MDLMDLTIDQQQAIEEVIRCVRKAIKIPDGITETFRAMAESFPAGKEKERLLNKLSVYVRAHENDIEGQVSHPSRNSLDAAEKILMTIIAVGIPCWTIYEITARGKVVLKANVNLPGGINIDVSLEVNNNADDNN